MIDRSVVEAQVGCTFSGIELPELGEKIVGKVRDSYVVGNKRILITSDRLSAFDRVLTTIPFKGQLLNTLASYWFHNTKHIVPNHIVAEPHPNILIGEEVEIIPVEVVVRGYLAGSAWRDYQAGHPVSGIELPKGLKKSAKFPEPLITPSTKAEHGEHDMPISSEDVVRSGIVEAPVWNEVCRIALSLFNFATEKLDERGLIFVDTKYEFGLRLSNGKVKGSPDIILADEVHTPDSSRFWLKESYQSRYESGEDPEMLDKEFVRRWLIERGYMGEGTPPNIPDDFRTEVAMRYIAAVEKITGEPFQPLTGQQDEKIRAEALKFVK